MNDVQAFSDALREALAAAEPALKQRLVGDLAAQLSKAQFDFQPPPHVVPVDLPGRPPRPVLVAPRELAQRGLGTAAGRAALVHAVAHIEFNAINLALDAAHRFTGMPAAYYHDWVSVAVDEARHFALLNERLAQLGYAYGDFDAHNGLWEMCLKTSADVLLRMALVPRVLEARGLDVTPGMIARLRGHGDLETVAVLELILREEVRHVEIGSRWFQWLCAERGLDADQHFLELIQIHSSNRIKPPFNLEARLRAGFSAVEMAGLNAL